MVKKKTALFLFLVLLTNITYAATDYRLKLLPENTRYFEWKGLPMILFCSNTFLYNTPGAGAIDDQSAHSNHIYFMCIPGKGYRDCGWSSMESKIKGDWGSLGSTCGRAFEKDMVVSNIYWSYKWNFSKQDWSGSDFINNRRDLHEIAIQKSAPQIWQYPNVMPNFMWEYNVRRGQDSDGSFHRWWVDKMIEEGEKAAPGVEHLFSIEYGGTHPEQNNAHCIVEEDGNGFWRSGASTSKVFGYQCPLVFWASDWWFNDRVHITPGQVRRQVVEGYHVAGSFEPPNGDALKYYLQARWYVENIKTWGNEPGDEISDSRVPHFTRSSRPELSNVSGYSNGAKVENGALSFSCIYKDPDGDPPAQTEVWVDMNGDGRFAPNPSDGERFEMQGSGSNYNSGVTYSISGIRPTYNGSQDAWYVFRFADKNWYPPQTGGVVPSNNSGISYNHWTIRADGGGSTVTSFTAQSGNPFGIQVTNQGGNNLKITGITPDFNQVSVFNTHGRIIPASVSQCDTHSLLVKPQEGLSRGLYLIRLELGDKSVKILSYTHKG